MVVISRWVGFWVAICFFFSFPQKIFASSVVINEIHPAEEWVELYNTSGPVSLDGCSLFLDDSDNQEIEFSDSETIDTFKVIAKDELESWTSSWINNNGDTVRLFCSGKEINSVAYGNENGAVVEKPNSNQTVGRSPDGGGWSILQPTRGSSNGNPPASSPSPGDTSSPNPESSSKAEYRINKPKDETGRELSRVEIYVDSLYTHHVDDEVLYFCDDCFCDNDKQIACGFGEHTIKLEKSGYEPWSESKNISEGDSLEVNPTLKALEGEEEDGEDEAGSSPEPNTEVQVLGSSTQKSSSNRQTPKTDDRNYEASFSGEILNASDSAEEEKEKQEEVDQEKNQDWLVPLGLSGGGLVLLSTAAFPFMKPKLTKLLTRFSKKDPTA